MLESTSQINLLINKLVDFYWTCILTHTSALFLLLLADILLIAYQTNKGQKPFNSNQRILIWSSLSASVSLIPSKFLFSVFFKFFSLPLSFLMLVQYTFAVQWTLDLRVWEGISVSVRIIISFKGYFLKSDFVLKVGLLTWHSISSFSRIF